MELIHVAAALFSALLHAGWNAAVKASPRPTETMAAQMLLAAIIIIPGYYWTGFPAPAAWPWIATSTALNVVAITAMLKAYEIGGFGMVYPIMRAVSLLCVVPLSALIAGDTISPIGAIGVALIAAALGILSWGSGKDSGFPRAALLWTMLSGATLALYVLSDARGVRASGSALAYGFTASIANGIVMSWRQRHLGSPFQHIASTWRISLPASIASSVSYLLILWVWSVAPIAPSAALRDTSAVFAILIAVFFLGERFTLTRLAAVVMAAAAIPLLRLG